MKSYPFFLDFATLFGQSASQNHKEGPQDNASRNRHIYRVFCTHLRNFYRTIAHIDNRLLNAGNLITEDQSILYIGLNIYFIEHRSTLDLLNGKHAIALVFQFGNALLRRGVIAPGHRKLGSECSLMDIF